MANYRDYIESRLVAGATVDPTTGCWNFRGAKPGKAPLMGITIPGRRRRTAGVARIAAWLWLGVELDGPHTVNHTCDNQACFNPNPGHIYVGTQKQNVQDMIRRGTFKSNVGENNGRHKVTWELAEKIRKLSKKGKTANELAEQFELSPTRVREIIRYKGWRKPDDPPPTPPKYSRISDRKKQKIRELYDTGNYMQHELARAAGITQAQVSRIVNGKR